MSVVGLCRHCGREVGDADTRVYAIQGYEETRTKGGQNHVLRKQRLDGYVWHKRCWERVMRHHDHHGVQEAML